MPAACPRRADVLVLADMVVVSPLVTEWAETGLYDI